MHQYERAGRVRNLACVAGGNTTRSRTGQSPASEYAYFQHSMNKTLDLPPAGTRILRFSSEWKPVWTAPDDSKRKTESRGATAT